MSTYKPSTALKKFNPAFQRKATPTNSIYSSRGLYDTSRYDHDHIPESDQIEEVQDSIALMAIDSSGNEPDSIIDDALAELSGVKVPDDKEDQDLFDKYVHAIQSMPDRPDSTFSGTCVVCGGSHNFDNCAVLRNKDFLRGHYIRFCTMLRKNAAVLRNVESNTGHSVNMIDARENLFRAATKDDYDADADEEHVNVQDFVRGGR